MLDSVDNQMIDNYSTKSWTARNIVKNNMLAGKPMPRSMCGLPVEVGGEVWGVVVIDSRSETLVEQEKISALYGQHAGVLSKLIQYTQ